VQHATRGPIRVLAPTVGLSRTPGRLERALGEAGEDSSDVLGELGYAPAEIEEMRASGVI
jgi:crotonobetainyl-CoA:carnitine CoA-transferase CaiB-like acyl-CoA transferase